MPKILINEKDRTSPGTPNSYANYAVLITGFKGEPKSNAIEPDANNVYEFSSAQAFSDTIGLVSPKTVISDSESGITKTIYHYGNQMAYELLNMGYSVVYKPIQKVSELGEASTWEIFKDKSSYDFRFITHGLLESTDLANNTQYLQLVNELADVTNAVSILKEIDASAQKAHDAAVGTDQEKELIEFKLDAYLALKATFDAEPNKYKGFIVKTTTKSVTYYATYTDAYDALIGTETAPGLESTLTARIENFASDLVTTDLINKANGQIANLAKYKAAGSDNTNDLDIREVPGRGDCIALIELDETKYVNTAETKKPEILIIEAINEMSQIDSDNGKFCAMTVPSVHYKMAADKAFDDNKKFPGAFHYLACFINSLKLGFAEWYAAAGYTRGVSSYIVDHTSVKLGEVAINALEPRNYDDPQSDYPKFACNVIAYFRGSYYLWGNRTAHPLGKKGNLETGDLVASSFLNIRQLCTTIKKQLYVACRTFTFDPNSDTLWVNFVNAIRPTLEEMKADQGIRDYKIIKVFTDKKATLKAKIRIIPIEAVEDFDLEVSLEDSFGETAAVVTE